MKEEVKALEQTRIWAPVDLKKSHFVSEIWSFEVGIAVRPSQVPAPLV